MTETPSSEMTKGAVLKGPILSGAIYISAAVINILMQSALAWWLGVEGFGVFSFVFNLILFLAIPATLGAQIGLLRYVPSYVGRHKWRELQGVVRFGIGSSVLGGAIFAILGVVTVFFFGDDMSPVLATSLMVGFMMLPLMTLVRSGASIVRGFDRLVHALIPNMMLTEFAIVIGIAVMFFLSAAPSPVSALWFALIGTCLSCLWLFVSGVRAYPHEGRGVVPLYQMRAWSATALPLLIVAISRLSFDRIGVLMVGGLADTDLAGIYALSARISDVVMFPLVAVNAYFVTRIASHYAKGQMQELQNDVKLTGILSMSCATCAAIPCLIFPDFLLGLFGAEFQAGANVLRILVVGQWLAVSVGSVSYLLSLTAFEKSAAFVTITAALANIALLVILIPLFGAEGAAWAFTVSLGGLSIVMALLVWRQLHLMPGIYASLVKHTPRNGPLNEG